MAPSCPSTQAGCPGYVPPCPSTQAGCPGYVRPDPADAFDGKTLHGTETAQAWAINPGATYATPQGPTHSAPATFTTRKVDANHIQVIGFPEWSTTDDPAVVLELAADGTVVWPSRILSAARILGYPAGAQYQIGLFSGSGSWNDADGSLSIEWEEGVWASGGWTQYQFAGRP